MGWEIVAAVASGVGTLVNVVGSIQQGEAAKQQAAYKAKIAEIRGKEEFAAGQRRMLSERRKKELALSSLQARAAAASGDTTDPGVINLGAGIEQEGEMRALTEFYRGENAKRGYQDEAAAARWQGDQAQTASYWKAGGSLLSGVRSFANAYGGFGGFGGTKEIDKSYGWTP